MVGQQEHKFPYEFISPIGKSKILCTNDAYPNQSFRRHRVAISGPLWIRTQTLIRGALCAILSGI